PAGSTSLQRICTCVVCSTITAQAYAKPDWTDRRFEMTLNRAGSSTTAPTVARSGRGRLTQGRVDQRVHHPSHNRLRLAIGRSANVLEDDHRFDAVDDRQRLQQASKRTGLQSPAQRVERGGENFGPLPAAEWFLLEQPGGFQRLVLERELERSTHVRLVFGEP